MKPNYIIRILWATALAALATLGACSEGKSYAELLTDENHYVNNFLADQTVVLDIPADTVFEVAPTLHTTASTRTDSSTCRCSAPALPATA